MTDNLPTTAQCREFTLLLGECWHEYEGKYKCSCGKIFCIGEDELVVEHLKLNPTYDSATILAKMKEKLGEKKFIIWLESLENQFDDNDFYTFTVIYILNPAALIDRASEYLEKEEK